MAIVYIHGVLSETHLLNSADLWKEFSIIEIDAHVLNSLSS
jgi:hypothetical protein